MAPSEEFPGEIALCREGGAIEVAGTTSLPACFWESSVLGGIGAFRGERVRKIDPESTRRSSTLFGHPRKLLLDLVELTGIEPVTS
jgi:hypothetical protein